jgi:hypothetical protein
VHLLIEKENEGLDEEKKNEHAMKKNKKTTDNYSCTREMDIFSSSRERGKKKKLTRPYLHIFPISKRSIF